MMDWGPIKISQASEAFTPSAKTRVCEAVEKYADGLIKQSVIAAKDDHSGSDDYEVIALHVEKAEFLKSGSQGYRLTRWDKTIDFLLPLLTLVIGTIASYLITSSKFEPLYVTLGTICLLLFLVFSFLRVTRG